MHRFEERLWSIIRNFIELGRANPALLVSAVRVVEMQETVDKQISDSGQCERLALGTRGRDFSAQGWSKAEVKILSAAGYDFNSALRLI